ncbi:MAG: hypothetical protein ABIQ31_00790 [Ferruginibacter sp.]
MVFSCKDRKKKPCFSKVANLAKGFGDLSDGFFKIGNPQLNDGFNAHTAALG